MPPGGWCSKNQSLWLPECRNHATHPEGEPLGERVGSARRLLMGLVIHSVMSSVMSLVKRSSVMEDPA